MSNRNSSPNAAFAYTGKIGGIDFKLLRHHKLDAVKDGNDHESVDKGLLIAALRMVDQVPVTAAEREEIRKHLNAHASFFQLDLAEDGVAARILNQQSAGMPQRGDAEVNRVENDGSFFEPPVELTPKTSTQAKVVLDDGDKPVDNPNKDKTDDDPDSPPAGSTDKTVYLDECDKLFDNPNKDKVGKASLAEESVATEDSAEAAKRTVKSENDLPDSAFAVIEKGGKKDDSGKTTPRNYRHLPYKNADGSIDLPHLRNALARMNQIKANSPDDSTDRIKTIARKVLVAAAKKNLPDSKFAKGNLADEQINIEEVIAALDVAEAIHKKGKPHGGKVKPHKGKPMKKKWSSYSLRDIVQNKKDGTIGIVATVEETGASICPVGKREMIALSEANAAEWEVLSHSDSEEGSKIDLEKGLTVVGSDEVLARMINAPKSLPIPATPTLEEQNKTGKVFLADDQEKLVESPNKDKVGKASLLYATVDDLTDTGRKLILKRLGEALQDKITAKIQSVEKVGSIDFVTLKLGNDKEFPMHVMMDVSRDAEGKVSRIRILNESLPGDVLSDFAGFLSKLSKESAKASVEIVPDQATAPAKLEKCVSDVMSQKVAKFRKANNREPNAKEKEKMKSSAFAICNASLKKS